VLLFIDDWAWNGSPVAMDDSMPNSRMPVLRMPNVEKLACDGMKFRNAYASPQCSPSRVCVQTGMSNPRSGFTVFMNDGGQDYYNEIAESTKAAESTPFVEFMLQTILERIISSGRETEQVTEQADVGLGGSSSGRIYD